jgi:hypothetical protein
VGPRMIVALLLDEARSESCTINSKNPPNVNRLANSLKVIEVYFARCLGMSLLTIAVLTVMLTGSIPLNATIAEPVSTDESDPKAPYALPTLWSLRCFMLRLHFMCTHGTSPGARELLLWRFWGIPFLRPSACGVCSSLLVMEGLVGEPGQTRELLAFRLRIPRQPRNMQARKASEWAFLSLAI